MRFRQVPIELDGEQGRLDAFAPFDELADRCRVAYIGEMDHFVAEELSIRLLVCRYLASRGWRIFGEEWPELEHQRPFRRGVLARERQPATDLDADQARFHATLHRAVPDGRCFSFDADGRDTDYIELAEAATTCEELRPAMARREQIVHEKVAQVLRDNPSKKVALLAAAQHLLKDDFTVSQACTIRPCTADSANRPTRSCSCLRSHRSLGNSDTIDHATRTFTAR